MSTRTTTDAWAKAVAEQENRNAGTPIFAKHVTIFKAEGGAE